MTSPGESPRAPRAPIAQVALSVPVERTATFSPRRTRSAIVAWLLFLVGVVAVGVVARVPQDERAPNALAEATATRAAVVGLPPTRPPESPTVTSSGGPARLPPPVSAHRQGSAVPKLSQADMERDGYRYYQELLARDPSARR